jgi:hypothetical protein
MEKYHNIPNLGNTCCQDSLLTLFIVSKVPFLNNIEVIMNAVEYITGRTNVYKNSCSQHYLRDSNETVKEISPCFPELQVIDFEDFDSDPTQDYVEEVKPITLKTLETMVNKKFLYLCPDMVRILLSDYTNEDLMLHSILNYEPIGYVLFNQMHYICVAKRDNEYYTIDDLKPHPQKLPMEILKRIFQNTASQLNRNFRVTGILYKLMSD